MSPRIHSNYARVLVTDVLEDFQNSFSTQKNLLFLVIIVDFNPLCREFQTGPSILGLESSTPTRGLRHKDTPPNTYSIHHTNTTHCFGFINFSSRVKLCVHAVTSFTDGLELTEIIDILEALSWATFGLVQNVPHFLIILYRKADFSKIRTPHVMLLILHTGNQLRHCCYFGLHAKYRHTGSIKSLEQ